MDASCFLLKKVKGQQTDNRAAQPGKEKKRGGDQDDVSKRQRPKRRRRRRSMLWNKNKVQGKEKIWQTVGMKIVPYVGFEIGKEKRDKSDGIVVPAGVYD